MKQSRPVLLIATLLLWMFADAPATAQDKRIRLGAPVALTETGFLKHLLPRFSLKNGIPITLVEPEDDADVFVSDHAVPDADPVFSGDGTTFYLIIPATATENPFVGKLRDWLRSDIGRKAIAGFSGPPAFTAGPAVDEIAQPQAQSGDVKRGADLSLRHCGRCHVIGAQNRMAGIGSTPSFPLLRTFSDWVNRFGTFYVLRPHPAFTRVEELSPPFPPDRPPVIEPVTLSLSELDDIVAYAASLAPADLGAPIRHQ